MVPLHLSPLWHLGPSRRAPPLNIGPLSVSGAGTTTPALPLGQPGAVIHSLPHWIPHSSIFVLLPQPSSDRLRDSAPEVISLDFRGNVTTDSPVFSPGPHVRRSVVKHTVLQYRRPFICDLTFFKEPPAWLWNTAVFAKPCLFLLPLLSQPWLSPFCPAAILQPSPLSCSSLRMLSPLLNAFHTLLFLPRIWSPSCLFSFLVSTLLLES